MERLMKRVHGYGIAAVLLALSMGASAGRANWAEYGYFDENGGMVGSITYWCVGRPIVEGEVTSDVRFIMGGTCL